MATEKFHYKVGTKTIVLPRYKHIPMGILRKLRKEDVDEQLFGLLETVADEKTLALLDELDQERFQEFYQAWQADSEVTQGESSAS